MLYVIPIVVWGLACAWGQLMCNKGEYLRSDNKSQESCQRCPEETYYPYDNHRNLDCASCDVPNDRSFERTLQECTRTSNAVIGCEAGSFRLNNYHDMGFITLVDGICLACSRCETNGQVEITPCGLFTNTVCCPSYDIRVTPRPGGFLRVECME